MLQKLHIQNYAIIDEIEINFSTGLNIITGETGAGKSIVMGALSLILGERADTSVLMHAEKKCFIEGNFEAKENKRVQKFLRENDLDETAEIILRREIAANGKSRAFINDSPATLSQLKQIAMLLVDLHSQFDTLELGNEDFQREVLDALANNFSLLDDYRKIFFAWQTAKNELQDLQTKKESFNKEYDYNRFLFDELYNAAFKENELEELEEELKILNNAEAIKTALAKINFELRESEQPVVTIVKQLVQQLNSYATHHAAIGQIIQRLQSAQIELQDIAYESANAETNINYDEKRIEKINEKLSAGYKLLKKHGLQTTNELLYLQKSLEEKLHAVLQIDDAITVSEKKVEQFFANANELANNISSKRKAQINSFEKKVNALLAQVGMPNASLKVEIKNTELSRFGKDNIEFLFDANKSNRFEVLKKVASGGELSRLMLCIKSLVAKSIELPSLIFDEIDTGISGEAARQVGIILKQLSQNRQVICITHQPQIAGKAEAHFFVYKEIKNEKIKTNIRLLTQEERITTIAKMLSGEKPTAAALENAREMVSN